MIPFQYDTVLHAIKYQIWAILRHKLQDAQKIKIDAGIKQHLLSSHYQKRKY